MYVVFKKSLTAFPGHQASSDAGLQTPTHPCRWKPLPGGSPSQCLPSPSVCSLGLSMPYDGIHHGPWNIEIQVLYSLTLLHHLIPFFEMINFFFFNLAVALLAFFYFLFIVRQSFSQLISLPVSWVLLFFPVLFLELYTPYSTHCPLAITFIPIISTTTSMWKARTFLGAYNSGNDLHIPQCLWNQFRGFFFHLHTYLLLKSLLDPVVWVFRISLSSVSFPTSFP